uniref:Uncharacterized protein n=1 Tax=Arundo donax TaxID=35708 RepID=A0A0A8Z340_ARUDO
MQRQEHAAAELEPSQA